MEGYILCMCVTGHNASINRVGFEKATKEAWEQALCVKGVHLAFYPTSNLSMSYKKGGEERASSYTQGKSRREERGLKLSAKVRVEGRRGEGLQASTQGQSRREERGFKQAPKVSVERCRGE